MRSFDEKMKIGPIGGALGAGRQIKLTKEMQVQPGVRNHMNSELWHACAGPLVSLPQAGSLVYYFPQGHIEQVAVSTKKTTTSQIPNYPDLPPQLLCQVQSLTMHADKDTDEVYAQMCLQPVISEKDVLPILDFGLRPSRHPSEFFCKTLTASDTSTHGGFSVPRRSAEKLFPPLDYKMQPPTQELILHDLHNNTWTFRHIYRGQPKRHLLTTGWSMFVGAKRLKAGDAVIFIRDERSRLLLGVRRANRQQTILPSSVLSADSMHIGVLAAASHAAANCTPFRIFYNPRACPSEFVVPLPKYHKSAYGTQVSAGARFGMVSETEDSGTRRYMGTVVGISDLDSFRWPGSKWRNIQVLWDEPGSGDKQSRVSAWEIEIPESLFIFPSLTSGLKQPLHSNVIGADNGWGNLIKRPFIQVPGNGYGSPSCTSMPSLSSEQLLNLPLKPQVPNHCEASQNPYPVHSENTIQFGNHFQTWNGPSNASKPNLPSSMIPEIPLAGGTKIAKPEPIKEQATQLASVNQQLAVSPLQVQMNAPLMLQQSESPQIEVSQLDLISPTALLPHMGSDELSASPDFGPLDPSPMFGFQDPSSGIFLDISSTFPPSMGDMWDNQLTNSLGNYSDLRDLSDETNLSGIYGGGGGAVIDPSFIPSILNTVVDEFGALKDSDFQSSSDCLFGNFTSSQDARSQLTSASIPDSSGVTSSSNVDLDESSLLQNGSWKQVSPPLRTYTKVQKAGSVGRSINVAAFKNYNELCCAIERMFGLGGLLNDSRSSGWKLVYVDYEDDVLLVGDDPWEVFVGCVRCIRILSPSEVEKLSEEGMELLNNGAMALRANLGH